MFRHNGIAYYPESISALLLLQFVVSRHSENFCGHHNVSVMWC
jgi:hypothetical protein